MPSNKGPQNQKTGKKSKRQKRNDKQKRSYQLPGVRALAATASATPGSALDELRLGRKLAHTEKDIRDKAFAELSAWLQSQDADVTSDNLELLKLWKGLFYCMWMADKPPIQNELGENIARLVHCMQGNAGLKFASVFFKTMQREWFGIDRLRMDKFYYLIRRVLLELFEFAKKREWDAESVAAVAETLSENVLNPSKRSAATQGRGLTYHVLDVYWKELGATCAEFTQLPQAALEGLLEPICNLVGHTDDRITLKRADDGVFRPMLEGWLDRQEEEEGFAANVRGGGYYDAVSVCDRLKKLATSTEIREGNRNALYGIWDGYKQATQHVRDERAAAEPEDTAAAEEPAKKAKGKRKKAPAPKKDAAEAAAGAKPKKKKRKGT